MCPTLLPSLFLTKLQNAKQSTTKQSIAVPPNTSSVPKATRSSNESSINAILKGINKKLDASQGELSKYEQGNEVLRNKNVSLQAQLKELQSANESLQKQSNDLTQSNSQNVSILELKRKLKSLANKKQNTVALNESVQQRENVLNSLKRQIQENEKKIKQLNKEKNDEIAVLMKQHHAKNKDVDECMQTVETMASRIASGQTKAIKLEQILANNSGNKTHEAMQNEQETTAINDKMETLQKNKDDKISQLNESLRAMECELSDYQSLVKDLKETNNELNKKNEKLILENAELNQQKMKIKTVLAKIEEMEKENQRLKKLKEDNEFVEVHADEYVDIGKESENENEEYVNVETAKDTGDGADEKKTVAETKKKGKKVHKLAMGLNIPMGGMKGGLHPLLAKSM